MVNVTVLDTNHKVRPVTVRPEDVRVDTHRGSGPGGQHRNKVASAVRLTHLPTGIVVTASEDRSQHRNRAVAWERLTEALVEVAQSMTSGAVNDARREGLTLGRTFTWTGWRDEVRRPDGRTSRMGKALRGDLTRLIG